MGTRKIERQLATLRERVRAHERIVEEQLQARDKAVDQLARETAEARNQPVISREEFNRSHDALVNRVTALEAQIAAATGTASGTLRIFLVAAVMISLAGLIVTIAHLVTG